MDTLIQQCMAEAIKLMSGLGTYLKPLTKATNVQVYLLVCSKWLPHKATSANLDTIPEDLHVLSEVCSRSSQVY